jgi:hypothetical protein
MTIVGACVCDAPTLQAQARPPIIDMHLHADLPPHDVPAGAPAVCRPEPCEGKGGATADQHDTLEKTLQAMDRHNIVKAFLSGVDPAIVQGSVAAAPGRFIAAPFILQPGRPAPEMLRREYAAGRLSGMGEIATQLTGVPPNDPALEPYFALAEELDLPTLVHTEGIGPYMPGFRVAAGNPVLLEGVLVRHPKLRLFIENAGYPYRDEMIAMMYQYPQLHADLSTISWVIPRTAFHDYLQAFVRAGLAKRLMFGSDQMRWPQKIGEGIEAVEQAPFLTAEQKRDILYNRLASCVWNARASDRRGLGASGPTARLDRARRPGARDRRHQRLEPFQRRHAPARRSRRGEGLHASGRKARPWPPWRGGPAGWSPRAI